MENHILLAFATSEYNNGAYSKDFQRPVLSQVLTSIVDLFTNKLKTYRHDLADIAKNPSKADLSTRLNGWFADQQRDSSDWVVLYYTGHATVVGADSLYLLTRDTDPDTLPISAFSVKQLPDMILYERHPGRPRRPGRMLIILDACFAGTAAVEFAAQFQKMLFLYSQNQIYLLSATLPNEEAQAGALAKALIESIEELSTRTVTQQYFSIEDVMEQIRGRLTTQEPFCIPVMITGVPHFFPNPNFADTRGRAVFANEAQRAILDQEFREHWGPRSRGVEFDTQPGNYFSGREAVLQQIHAYLSGKGTMPPLVITGKPGAGKSAILSRIVAQSRDPLAGIPSLDIVVHAKGKTLADVTARFAAATSAGPEPKLILDAIAQSRKTTRILVDALDEAAEPDAIAEALLRPMGANPNISMLVGSRVECLPLLGDVDTVDIDLPEYAKDADIAAYAKARLLRTDEPHTPTPYAGKEELAAAAASMIAKRADKNFLVARLLVEDLLLRPQPLDLASSAKLALPATVAVAFDAYLARFGARETLVRDLLLPLAYSEGKGFPWGNLWAQVASHLAKRTYHDDDIRWLLGNAGAFILESIEDGQAVYRLYHLALQEALRSRHHDPGVQRSMTEALIDSVPHAPDSTQKEWLLANRYIRRHLPAHAAAAGELDDLLLDPMFLVAAIPSGVLPVLRAAAGRDARRASRIYKMAAHYWHPDGSPGTWASYLELAARKLGLEMAWRLGQLSIARPWRIPWVALAPSSAHRVLRGHEGSVRALAIQNDMVISAGDDGAIRCWDIETGEGKREPFRGHEGAVHAVSAGKVKNREVVVSAGEDSTVRIWSLQTGTEILPPMRGHNGPVYAVLLLELQDDAMIVSGGYDGTIRCWNPETGRPVQTALQAHDQWVRALASFRNYDGTAMVVSAGGAGSIRVWTMPGQQLIAEAKTNNVVDALACLQLNGKTVVVSAGHSGRVDIWEPYTMTPVPEPIGAASIVLSLAASNFQGNPLLITAKSIVIKVWNAETQQMVVPPMAEHDAGVFANAAHPSGAVIASGGLDQTVRLWHLEEARRKPSFSPESPFGQDSDVWSVTACRSIVVARSHDKRIRRFQLSTGLFLGQIPSGDDGFESAIALADAVDGSMLAFDRSGGIFTCDLAKPYSGLLHLGPLGSKAHALLFHGSEPAGVLTALSGAGRIKSWDMVQRKQISDLEIDIRRGWHDSSEHWKDTLALGTLGEGRPIVLSGGSGSGLLRIWRADTGELIRELPVSAREQTQATAVALGSRRVVEVETNSWTAALALAAVGSQEWIASGNSYGTLTLWDAKTFAPIASLPGDASIYALAIASIAGRPALVWGGKDHHLHAWWPETNRRESIDLGFPVNAIAVAPDETVIAGTAHGIIAVRFEGSD